MEIVFQIIHLLHEGERRFRPKVGTLVKEYQLLIDDPKEWFFKHDALLILPFKPITVPFFSSLFGVGASLVVGVGIQSLVDPKLKLFTDSQMWAIGIIWCGLWFAGTFVLIQRVASCGLIKLTLDHVELSFGKNLIVAPWKLFAVRHNGAFHSEYRYDILVRNECVAFVEMKSGPRSLDFLEHRKKPFRLRQSGETATRDPIPATEIPASM